jgi:hypothetical protein
VRTGAGKSVREGELSSAEARRPVMVGRQYRGGAVAGSRRRARPHRSGVPNCARSRTAATARGKLDVDVAAGHTRMRRPKRVERSIGFRAYWGAMQVNELAVGYTSFNPSHLWENILGFLMGWSRRVIEFQTGHPALSVPALCGPMIFFMPTRVGRRAELAAQARP